MTDDPIVELRGVQHDYGNQVLALDGVDLRIRPGEFIAVIGRNGSGKTTLAKHLNGMLRPTNADGEVLLRDADGTVVSTRDRPLHRLAAVVGYVFQNPDRQIFHDTCRAELEFGPRNLGVARAAVDEVVTATLERMELADHAETNPVHMSRGQRQRLAIAATLAMRPRVAVVDEPTTGQDHREARLILDFLRAYQRDGGTVVIVSHDMALVAEHASRVVAMRDGRVLADGTPREVFASPDVLSTTNIRPPQVCVLGQRLGHPGLLTVPEAVDTLAAARHRKGA